MRHHHYITALLGTLFATACGGQTETPWEPDTARVVSPDGTEEAVPWSDDCVEVESGECIPVAEYCGEGNTADVYLDEEGNVVETVCYPTGEETPVVDLVTDGEIPQNENGAILVVSGDADSPAYEGDLSLDSNRLTLYGDDPASAVIDGNVTVDGNNALISGVTVTGNLRVVLNDAQISGCVVEGNLIIEGNNTVVVGCHVNGNIEVAGQNTRLSLNSVDGNIENSGNGTECVDNYRGDSLETGEALTCE